MKKVRGFRLVISFFSSFLVVAAFSWLDFKEVIRVGSPVEAALQPQAKLIYKAQPKQYTHQVKPPYYSCSWCTNNAEVRDQDKGKAFPGNQNPFGFEIYQCDSKNGSIRRHPGNLPLDFYAKRNKDICIPRASTQNGIKRWPAGVAPNFYNYTCDIIQHLIDGPHQQEDARTLNGTGLPNSQIDICTRVVNQPGPHPYLNITVPFNYQPFMCSGNNDVVLAGRPDPKNPECTHLNVNDVMRRPWAYSQSQLSCFLYFDDFADVTACKGGVCNSMRLRNSMNGVHPAPQPSQSLCSLFVNGAGEYQVNIKVYDGGAQVYGTSDLWLTWKTNTNTCNVTAPTNLSTPVVQSNEITFTWKSGSGGDRQWIMIDTNRSKIENNCAGGCLIFDQNLWSDQETYVVNASRGIKPNTTYYWKVVEVGSSCQAESAIATVTTPPCSPPLVPRDLRYSVNGCASEGYSPPVIFSWSRVPGADRYQIQVSTDRNFTGVMAINREVSNSSYATSELSANTNYYWRVRAHNSCGRWSGWVTSVR